MNNSTISHFTQIYKNPHCSFALLGAENVIYVCSSLSKYNLNRFGLVKRMVLLGTPVSFIPIKEDNITLFVLIEKIQDFGTINYLLTFRDFEFYFK